MNDPLVDDVPYLLQDPGAVAERKRLLGSSRMLPLATYAQTLRERSGGAIPDFDSWDGGTEAKALVLLEAPSGRAIQSGFVSMNNPDPTARLMHETVHGLGLDRRKLILWNIVPWYVGDEERRRIRAVSSRERASGVAFLRELLPLLPDLRAVLTLGTHAKAGWEALNERLLHIAGPHPSSTNLNARPHLREEFKASVERIGKLL